MQERKSYKRHRYKWETNSAAHGGEVGKSGNIIPKPESVGMIELKHMKSWGCKMPQHWLERIELWEQMVA